MREEEEGRRGRNIGAGDFFRSRRGGERCEGGVNREHGPDTLEPAAEAQNIFLVLDRPGLTASTTDGPDITACKKSSRRKSGNGAWRAPTSRLTRPHSLSLSFPPEEWINWWPIRSPNSSSRSYYRVVRSLEGVLSRNGAIFTALAFAHSWVTNPPVVTTAATVHFPWARKVTPGGVKVNCRVPVVN